MGTEVVCIEWDKHDRGTNDGMFTPQDAGSPVRVYQSVHPKGCSFVKVNRLQPPKGFWQCLKTRYLEDEETPTPESTKKNTKGKKMQIVGEKEWSDKMKDIGSLGSIALTGVGMGSISKNDFKTSNNEN